MKTYTSSNNLKPSREQFTFPMFIESVNDEDDIIVTYEIISPPRAATGPSYSSGGEPSECAEYNIISIIAIDWNGKEKEKIDWMNLSDKETDVLHDAILVNIDEQIADRLDRKMTEQ